MLNAQRHTKFFLFILLLSSCAQVVSPSGGIKDTVPPGVVKYSPDSASLHFNSKSILINFDEYVQLHDLNTQLIISPPMEKTPEITVQKKTLSIVLDKDEHLKPNTTYTISFGNALQDVNEGNPLENFKYFFSTGDFIDSLFLKGKVQNALNHVTEKNIVVMLYNDLTDSAVYKGQPDYFARTAADGTFAINNIKTGKYKLAAVKDVNANYKYDGEAESIAFVDAPIDVSEKQEILMDLFQEPGKKIYLKKYIHDSYGKFTFIFNQGSDSLRVQPLNNDQKGVQEYREFSKHNDTITYWIKNFIKDSLIMQVSNGNKVLDTVGFKFIKMEDALKSKKNPLKLRVLSSPNGNQSFDLNSEIKLKFSQPISTVTFESDSQIQAKLKKDSSKIFKISSFKDTIIGETVTISKVSHWLADSVSDPNDKYKKINVFTKSEIDKWQENTNYNFLILPGTFTDIYGLTNDSIKINFKTQEEKFYGSVKLNLLVPSKKADYIVQLLDERDNVVRENFVNKSQALEYSYLYPKKYKLKIIFDANKNGKWDSGNYLQKTQPEKAIYNAELINIRSNWDAELDWKIE